MTPLVTLDYVLTPADQLRQLRFEIKRRIVQVVGSIFAMTVCGTVAIELLVSSSRARAIFLVYIVFYVLLKCWTIYHMSRLMRQAESRDLPYQIETDFVTMRLHSYTTSNSIKVSGAFFEC